MSLQPITRRCFLKSAAKCGFLTAGALTGIAGSLGVQRLLMGETPQKVLAADRLEDLVRVAPRARYWVSTAGSSGTCQNCHEAGSVDPQTPYSHKEKVIKCLLCAQGCVISENDRGKCHTRYNLNGELRTLVYGRPISIHIDPIEKKPFYHFLPGATAFSLGTSGCPLHCRFCQNWEISQIRPEDYSADYTPPEAVVRSALSRQAPVIAFTYNEPTVFAEYLTDIARVGRPKGLRSVLVSCGFMNSEPLSEMCEVLDGIKIDLKGFSEDFYRKVCSAELKPVLRSIKQIARSGRHLEIVNLVVPTLNDTEQMLKALAEWVAGELGPDVPVHFTRFHPDYQLLNLPPTPITTLERGREIAMKHGIRYAYVGNVPGHAGNNTYCPGCGQAVIVRQGFFASEVRLKGGKCAQCGEKIAGVWN
jgi:pyruvate formate lyase activating enzyme